MYSDRTISANMAADGTTGTIFLVAEICQYDDTVVTGANYKPGHPDTEANITVVDTGVLQFDVAPLRAMTNANLNTFLDQQLDAWVLARKPAAATIAPIVLAAQKRPARVIP